MNPLKALLTWGSFFTSQHEEAVPAARGLQASQGGMDFSRIIERQGYQTINNVTVPIDTYPYKVSLHIPPTKYEPDRLREAVLSYLSRIEKRAVDGEYFPQELVAVSNGTMAYAVDWADVRVQARLERAFPDTTFDTRFLAESARFANETFNDKRKFYTHPNFAGALLGGFLSICFQMIVSAVIDSEIRYKKCMPIEGDQPSPLTTKMQMGGAFLTSLVNYGSVYGIVAAANSTDVWFGFGMREMVASGAMTSGAIVDGMCGCFVGRETAAMPEKKRFLLSTTILATQIAIAAGLSAHLQSVSAKKDEAIVDTMPPLHAALIGAASGFAAMLVMNGKRFLDHHPTFLSDVKEATRQSLRCCSALYRQSLAAYRARLAARLPAPPPPPAVAVASGSGSGVESSRVQVHNTSHGEAALTPMPVRTIQPVFSQGGRPRSGSVETASLTGVGGTGRRGSGVVV